MRAGELLGLEWYQFDLASAVLYLDITKNGTPRLVPLPEKAEQFLVRELIFYMFDITRRAYYHESHLPILNFTSRP